MLKRLLSAFLVLMIVSEMGTSAFAVTVKNNETFIENNRIIINEDVVYVDDCEGNLIPVTIIEKICIPDNSGIAPKSFSSSSPKVGEKRYYTVKVSNEALGIPSLAAGALSFASKKKVAQIVAEAIAKKLGSNFVPGLNVASWILSAAAMANALSGKAGIQLTVELEYTETYLHKEGYYIYGWNTRSLSVSRY